MAKSRLGKGLGALIPLEKMEGAGEMIAVEKIKPNPFQPREEVKDEGIKDLAQSIKEHGIIQPLLLRKIDEGEYEIVAGERRLRAAKLAELEMVPAIVRECTEKEMMEIALIENLQREDLNPIDEAKAYQRLIKEFKLTQDEVAKRIGKNRSTVANVMRILSLPPEVLSHVSRETISLGHARALLSLSDAESKILVAEEIIKLELNVRQTERLVKEWEKKKKRLKVYKEKVKTQEIEDWEKVLYEALGTKVQIQPRSREKGSVQIEYRSLPELKKICALLRGEI